MAAQLFRGLQEAEVGQKKLGKSKKLGKAKRPQPHNLKERSGTKRKMMHTEKVEISYMRVSTRSKAKNLLARPSITSVNQEALPSQGLFQFDGSPPKPIENRAKSHGLDSRVITGAAYKMNAGAPGRLLRSQVLKAGNGEKERPIEQRTLSESTSKVSKTGSNATAEAAATIAAAVQDAAIGLPKLQQLHMLETMCLQEEALVLQGEMKEMLQAAQATAEGEAGDSCKYEKAALTVQQRCSSSFRSPAQSRAKEPSPAACRAGKLRPPNRPTSPTTLLSSPR